MGTLEVAHGDGAPERRREAALLANVRHEHIVRLRVLVEGRLLRDVGGPYVLGPVAGTLRQGGGVIGTFEVSKSTPDGYTLLMMSNTQTANESLVAASQRKYELMKDLAPIALTAVWTITIASHLAGLNSWTMSYPVTVSSSPYKRSTLSPAVPKSPELSARSIHGVRLPLTLGVAYSPIADQSR